MEHRRTFSDTLVVVYGMACPLDCDFCCHSTEEYGPGRMDREEAVDWIRQAGRLPSIGRVVITGGEPFVYYRDLIEILEATADCGLAFRIVTSAHWAKSLEDARRKLRPLHERGLSEISVSTDPSHQAFVPAAFAENAVTAARELGIAAELAGVFWDADTRVEDVVQVPEGVSTTRRLAIPVHEEAGRAVTPDDYGLGPERFRGCGLPRSYDVTIYPDGRVYPCCSGGFNVRAELAFGNLRQEQLADVLQRIHADRYTRLVTGWGFLPIYELARHRWPGVAEQLPDFDPVVTPCQLCALVHSDPALLDALDPVLRYADRLFGAVEDLWRQEARPGEEVPRA